MRRVRDVLRLCWWCGLSERAAATSCALAGSTVAKYLARAREAGLAWPLPEDLEAQRWIFAKTMPDNPHWYALRKEWQGILAFPEAVAAARTFALRAGCLRSVGRTRLRRAGDHWKVTLVGVILTGLPKVLHVEVQDGGAVFDVTEEVAHDGREPA